MKKHVSLVPLLVLAILPCAASDLGTLQMGYESRHIYRGVDSALDEAIQWSSATVNLENAYVGLWYGTGPSSDYEEVDLFGGYVFDVDGWRVIPNFIWYHFPDNDDQDSTDLMIKVARDTILENGILLTPELIYSYNIDAEGSYAELAIVATLQLQEDWTLSLRPAIALSDGLRPEDGPDHAELVGRIGWAVNDALTASVFTGYSVALDAIDSFCDDELWGGLTLSASF
jgi:hypothetical protein